MFAVKLFTDLWPLKLLAHNQWNQPLPVLRENQMMWVGDIVFARILTTWIKFNAYCVDKFVVEGCIESNNKKEINWMRLD